MAALRRILLATDLSARCDRALERAASLAASRSASLTILHVLEPAAAASGDRPQHALPSWQRPPDAVALAKERIRQGLHAEVRDLVERATVVVEEGDPPAVIERVAAESQCDLIVTGIAHETASLLCTVALGRTVERLLRQAAAPLLIVRNRGQTPYAHILVTTDFSPSSAPALQIALRFFPDQGLRLLHAFEAPYAGFMSDPAVYETRFGAALEGELEAFLDTLGCSTAERQRIQPLIEPGRAIELVLAYVHDRRADLVVLGTHGRGALLETLTGSTAKGILASLPCDALVVRGPRHAG